MRRGPHTPKAACKPSQAGYGLTFTCSLDVTAQKTISVKPWVGNMRKQMPPITRPSLMSAKVLCFLRPNRQ